jgi:hypothetical protein
MKFSLRNLLRAVEKIKVHLLLGRNILQLEGISV